MPTPPRNTSMAVKMAPIILFSVTVSHSWKASFIDGSKPWRSAITRCTAANAAVVSPFSRRLILDGGQRVARNIAPLQHEQFLHRRDRDIDLLVVEVIVAARDFIHRADHGELGSIDGHRFAHRRMALEQKQCRLGAKDGNAPPLGDVGIIQEPALRQRDEPHRGIGRINTHDVARGVAPLAHFVEIGPRELEGEPADFGQMPDGFSIAQG